MEIKKILVGMVMLISVFVMGCSNGGDEMSVDGPIIEVAPKPEIKIQIYEDTVFINKSGGNSMIFLSYPNNEDIDVVNQNDWLTMSPFTNYYEILSTSIANIEATLNTSDRERIGNVYFRYRDGSLKERRDLMDTLVVIQLNTDSVFINETKSYYFDEYASELAVFVPYSDYYTSVDDTWITETTTKLPDSPRCKFNFFIQELPDELDLRVSRIQFSQPKDTKSVTRIATIEQRRAIAIKNRINVMKVNMEHQLELDLSLAVSNQNMIFKSSDESVATISKEGKISTLTKGNTIITVESEDGKHIAKMPISVKTLLSQDDNHVSIGMGIEISAGIRFFVSIRNGSDKDIHLDKMTIKNNNEIVYFENSESILGTLAAGECRLLYFTISANSYVMDCELQYTLDGKQFVIGEESGIIIQ